MKRGRDSDHPDPRPPAVLHGLDPPLARLDGLEVGVDLVSSLLPALAVAFAGRQENNGE